MLKSTLNCQSESICTKILRSIASLPLVLTLLLEVFESRFIVRKVSISAFFTPSPCFHER